jgi:hypothetical protein
MFCPLEPSWLNRAASQGEQTVQHLTMWLSLFLHNFIAVRSVTLSWNLQSITDSEKERERAIFSFVIWYIVSRANDGCLLGFYNVMNLVCSDISEENTASVGWTTAPTWTKLNHPQDGDHTFFQNIRNNGAKPQNMAITSTFSINTWTIILTMRLTQLHH